MLNKELLMVGSEPVLSIYTSPDVRHLPSVSGTLSSGEAFYTRKPGETTFKFSEIEPTEIITISYFEDMELSTSNLMPVSAPYSGGVERASAVMQEDFRIMDRTQPASISLT